MTKVYVITRVSEDGSTNVNQRFDNDCKVTTFNRNQEKVYSTDTVIWYRCNHWKRITTKRTVSTKIIANKCEPISIGNENAQQQNNDHCSRDWSKKYSVRQEKFAKIASGEDVPTTANDTVQQTTNCRCEIRD